LLKEELLVRRLYRSEGDKKIAGICGGIAETYGVDANLLRVAAVFVGLATGGLPRLVAYRVGWILIPTASGTT
jgi:phage shock protein C